MAPLSVPPPWYAAVWGGAWGQAATETPFPLSALLDILDALSLSLSLSLSVSLVCPAASSPPTESSGAVDHLE